MGGRLSGRRVRGVVRIGQRWSDSDGAPWTVRQVHRKDGLVAVEGPGRKPRYVSFGELGKHYRLEAPR